MYKLFFLAINIFVFGSQVVGQSYWKAIDEGDIKLASYQEREIIPEQYASLALDYKNMQSYIQKAPMENLNNNQSSKLILELPLPNGELESYKIYRSSAMMTGLSAKYPNIQTFVGYASSGNNVLLDFSTLGFHASIWTKEGIVYIDPYVEKDFKHYISYFVKDHIDTEVMNTSCGLETSDILIHRVKNKVNFRTENIPLRTYRLALACTGEHGVRFSNVEDILAHMNTTVNRLNIVYINELSIKVELVDNNDKLIHTNRLTDPYPIGATGREVLGVNSGVLNQRIGSNNYDLGHVFTKRCTDVGGVAFLGSVCNGNKGGGVTCIGNSAMLNFSFIKITLHEMGHQFGASHTFNNCNGNESTGSAFEPGGGSTIMSYDGLCGSNSFVNTNHDNYHNYSLQQIFTTTRGSNGCGTTTDIGNHTPVALHDYEDGFFIPISTPFELTGDATDEDGDAMTYSWEEMDKGPITPLGKPVGNSPLFRALAPGLEKTRYLPDLKKVRGNTSDKTEILPTYSRDVKFRFVVRDNHPKGGLADWKQVDFASTVNAGPFLVTHPNGYLSTEVGATMEVTWNVANTDGPKVNTQSVDIYLSDDDGQTFDKLLASNVPNDGVQNIVVPNIITEQARIKVKAHKNIFYDMSNRTFTILEPTTGFYFEINELTRTVCLPISSTFEMSTIGFNGFSESIHFDIPDVLPDGIVASFSKDIVVPGQSTSLIIDMNDASYNGNLPIRVRAIVDNLDTIYQVVVLDITSNDFSELNLLTPEDNTVGAGRLLNFEWNTVADADQYTFELATSPSFGDNIIYSENEITGNTYEITDLLDLNTLYYWHVIGHNRCGDHSSKVFVFGTQAKSCKTYEAINLPKAISASGKPTIEAIFDIPSTNTVVDINIKKISLIHDFVGNLSGSIISPSGNEVKLWHRKCSNLGKINCGFDDEAEASITCPMVGVTYRPIEKLDIFNGEDINGQWKLELKDNAAGDGGEFKSASIEVCANESLNSPYLFQYKALGVQPDNENKILNDFLWVKDDDNTPQELIYTVVTLPSHGMLRYNNIVVKIGATFTQSDIDNGRLSYRHNGDNSIVDGFDYTVIDGNGGWIPKAEFEIKVGDNYPNATESIALSNAFEIYPNPASEVLHITQIDRSSLVYNLQIFNIDGKLLKDIKLVSDINFNLSLHNLSAGIYVLKIISGTNQIHRKISIVK